MADISGTITSGNFFRQELNMTGDVTLEAGCFILAEFTTNGNNLTINGGNVNGIYIDTVKQDAFVWQSFKQLDKALQISDDVINTAADLNFAALEESIRIILVGSPTQTKATFLTALDSWLVANNAYFDASRFGEWFMDQIDPSWTWAQVRDFVRQYDAATWKGAETVLDEEYS